MQGRIQVQIAKRQVRTLELGDRILQLGIERRQLVRVEDGASHAPPAGFGQSFFERTLPLAGRLSGVTSPCCCLCKSAVKSVVTTRSEASFARIAGTSRNRSKVRSPWRSLWPSLRASEAG